MPRLPKAERLPDSSFAEPSEPSQLRPEDKPAPTLRGEQEENPQLVAHNRGRQSGDAKGTNAARPRDRDAAKSVDEQKRRDVAGGLGLGRGGDHKAKL